MNKYNSVTNFEELIEVEHGEIGTESRNKYEENAQMFIISEMLKEARKRGKSYARATCREIGNEEKLHIEIRKC